jgi:hypothetical protein
MASTDTIHYAEDGVGAAATVTERLRIPRFLWEDLVSATAQQDELFLNEVSRSLGLDAREVKAKCLYLPPPPDRPAARIIPAVAVPVVLGPTTTGRCPWWECHGDGLWRRCPRGRLTKTLPCAIHERCTPCPLTRLDSDPLIQALPIYEPIRHKGHLYWYDPKNLTAPLFREDGTRVTTARIVFLTDEEDGDGERKPFWMNLKPEMELEE